MNFLHVWTLFNKLETIAVQQEILVSSVDKYASVQQENPGVALAQESARVYQLSRHRLASRKKNPTLNPLQYHKMLIYKGMKSRYRVVYPVFVPNITYKPISGSNFIGKILVRFGQ